MTREDKKRQQKEAQGTESEATADPDLDVMHMYVLCAAAPLDAMAGGR